MTSLIALLALLQAVSADDPVARFVGLWAVGPADVEGFDTIRPEQPACEGRSAVTIEAMAPDVLRRHSRGRTTDFNVRVTGDGYIWTLGDDAEGYRIRFTPEGAFQLASQTGPEPDWSRAHQHWPCATH